MKTLFPFIFLLFTLSSNAQFVNKKVYNTYKVEKKPVIDGFLDESLWEKLPIAKDFVQEKPNNGKLERINTKTEIKVCYDNSNIYFGAIMYDNAPDSILKELSKRDDDNKNNDILSIVLDPFNNSQVEYIFSVTAAGVQIDAKKTKNGEDKSWDAVWSSAIKINKNGWVAEVAIPFSQLRFSDNNQYWSINFFRKIRRYRENYSWNAININFEDYSLQSGLLKGIKNIKSPIRLSFMPYASIYANSYSVNDTIRSIFPYNYGLDLKYGINESFTLDMTLIPDFGQTGSDAMVLNLSPFEVKYEEKRQFFNEGIELFNKGDEMFYSRRLENNLINASKLSGRTDNGFGFSLLNAITNKNNGNPLTNFNVFIIDKAINNSSSISLMNTNMTKFNDSKDANVIGLFSSLSNREKTHLLNSNFKVSNEIYTDSSDLGFSGMISFEKNTGGFRYKLYSSFNDEIFNQNDLGFSYLYNKNKINSALDIGFEQLEENKNFIFSKHYIFIKHNMLFTNKNFVDLEFEAESKFMLKNYLFIMGKIIIHPYDKRDYYEARSNDYNNPVNKSKSIEFSTYLSSDYRNKIAIDFGCGFIYKPLYDGKELRARISPRIRINDRISMKYVLSLRSRFNEIGFVANDTSYILIAPPKLDYIFATRNTYMVTNVINLDFIINNKLNLITKFRYHIDKVKNNNFYELNNNGYLDYNDYYENQDINYSTWTADIALNWRFLPGSQLSFVWKNGVDFESEFLYNFYENIRYTYNALKNNSLSLKLIYYIDYLKLKS